MINILNSSRRRGAISLADRLMASDQTDPSLLDNATPEQIRAVHGELALRAKQCVDEVARLQAESLEQAQAFIKLTNDFIASDPPMLRGAK